MGIFKKKRDKSVRKIWLSRALYASGGALICAVIILPITLTQCNRVSKKVPVTKKFYKFANDGSILGWSDEVINNPQILQKYQIMNLHGQTINGLCRFTMNDPTIDTTQTIDVFNKWACYGMDLSDTKWLTYHISQASDLNYAYTGYHTFTFATLGYCHSLNLSGASFTTQDNVNEDIITASFTFAYANFSSLQILNLSETNFTAFGSWHNRNINANDVVIQTAGGTFSHTNFVSLETLNLSGAVFAANSMTDSMDVRTASYTFSLAVFTSLKTLDFSGAVFSTANMIVGNRDVKTGYKIFEEAEFNSLTTLNLGDCKLGDSNTGDNTIDSTCFGTITKNQTWSSIPLQLKSENKIHWQEPTQTSQLNTWFGDGWWAL